LRLAAGRVDGYEQAGETVMLGGTEDLIVTSVSATRQALEGLALYDYISVVKLKWKGQGIASGEVEVDRSWPSSKSWIRRCSDRSNRLSCGRDAEPY
jgi:hypothetical protein